MITIQNYDDPKILGFTLEGELREEEIEKFTKAFEDKSQQGTFHLLGEIENIGGFEDMEAFSETIKMKTEALKDIDKIDKYAVVTDKKWMENLASVGGFFIPGISLRFFDKDEKPLAIQWLKQSVSQAYSPGIRPIALPGNEQSLGYVINGKIEAKDYDVINQELEQLTEKKEEVNLYIEIVALKGYTLKAMWEDFKTGIEYYKHLNKVALVSHKEWVENAAKAGDFMTPGIDMKFFNINEKTKALDWLKD
ncbi:MAG: STAS/SEC14 domain-containing protein [Cyclobacteriaceae bacterium]